MRERHQRCGESEVCYKCLYSERTWVETIRGIDREAEPEQIEIMNVVDTVKAAEGL